MAPDESPDTAESLLKALAAADNKIATITGQLKDAKQTYDAIADRMFALMDAQGTETIRNSKIGLQVSIGETQTDTIEDWPRFESFVLRHKLLHLLQRRISPVALREYLEGGPKRKVPGLGSFSKRRLHVTKISK